MRELVKSLKYADPQDVVIIGDMMLDEYLIGSVSRISPEAPVPIINEQSREFSFGGAANVAINCKRVGCTVSLIGLVSDTDETGKKLLAMLTRRNVFIEGVVKSSHRATTRKKRIVSQQQQLLRIDVEDTRPLFRDERESLVCHIHTIIKPGSIVLISDYAKGVIDAQMVQEIIVRASVCSALVIADPKGPRFDKYHGVDYLKPNHKEFDQMVDFFGLARDHSMVENGEKICSLLQLKGLFVTMGDQGLQFIAPGQHLFYPAYKQEVYDITGAGDTVLAFLAVSLVNGLSIDQSLKVANKAASVAVSHHKTYAVGFDELIDSRSESSEKVFSEWKSLYREISWLRQERKRKVVFTNGCFDLLHSGHIYLLQEAKKRGDILIVGLNTNDSVARLKGAGRPIKTLAERARIISAIDAVDYVVSFDQDTPYRLIELLKPDFLIKGGDYKPESIVGYELVTEYGGVVEVVEYQQGLSTSHLVDSVKGI